MAERESKNAAARKSCRLEHKKQGGKMKAGDKVKSNGRYGDVQAKFGDTVQTVRCVGFIPSCKKQMVWLEWGGGCFSADGFDVVSED